MEERKAMTVEEVVHDVIAELSGIRVPAGMIDDIGIPVSRAIRNLRLCVEAWEREARAAGQDPGEDGAPAIELFPEEGVN